MDKDRIERSPCRLRREVGEVIEIITNFAVERCQVNRIDTEVLRKTLFGLRRPAVNILSSRTLIVSRTEKSSSTSSPITLPCI